MSPLKTKAIIFVSVYCLGARAGTTFIPTTENVHQAGQGADCAVYRIVVDETQRTIVRSKVSLEETRKLLEGGRAAVEQCGTRNGLRARRGGWDEAALAEFCIEEYRAWLAVGYTYHAVIEDIAEAQSGLALVQGKLTKSCATPPTAIAARY